MCVPNFVASNYQKFITDHRYITHIPFFFLLYWFAHFLKFGPLPSDNSRCRPDFSDVKTCSDPIWPTSFLSAYFRTPVTVKQTYYRSSYISRAALVIMK